MKSLVSFHLEKGDIIRLKVVSPKGWARFLPAFLDKDGHIPINERSARFPQPVSGVTAPKITEGEIWEVEVVAIKLEPTKNNTKDGRRRVIVFCQNYRRIERQVKKILNERQGIIETWSGERLISTEGPFPLYERTTESIKDNVVTIVHSYYRLNKGLFFKRFEYIKENKFIERLRKNGIDPRCYFKKNKLVA